MSIPMLTQSSLDRLNRLTLWGEAQMGLSNRDPIPQRPNQPSSYAIRGFLLQNIYGNGSGAMILAYRSQVTTAAQISIVGKNFIPGSQFKIAVSDGTSDLFITQPIPANATASLLQHYLLLAAQAANLPVQTGDIQVALGNPISSPEIVVESPVQPDLTIPDKGSPISYVGSWIILIGGAIARVNPTLYFHVVQDSDAFMRGLSSLISRPVKDLPGQTVQIVYDVQNRPSDYPWVAGSLCGCVQYNDLGYGIQWSDFREQTLVPVSSS